MKYLPTVFVCSVLSLIVVSATLWPTKAEAVVKKAIKPLKGMLITGGCCHDYETQKKIITKGISQRVNIEWEIIHEGGTSKAHQVSVYKYKDWAKDFDVIVHNECFGDVMEPAFIKNITEAHAAGVPAVFIHCSLHSYRHSKVADLWRELIGVTSRSHEKKHPIAVKNLKADHPIMKDFPKSWPVERGELYKIEKVWPGCTPLAQAYGVDTQKNHTTIWINELGKTKVFGTSLGHFNETMNNDVWLGVVSRGLLWTVEQLDNQGKPKPGYEGTGVAPMEFSAK